MAETATDLPDRLYGRLPEPAVEALRATLAVAAWTGTEAYLVGGAVRDLLLDVPAELDLDLVVEADALALASDVGAELGARVVSHERFGTASVRGAGFRVDLARARSERYERPGALPAVAPATLAEDLGRRDFTINALALCLTGPEASELIDPHGGRTDLASRTLRALHERSFQDDATRILRGLRYAARYDLTLERGTRAWLRRDLPYLDTIGGARVRHEFERIVAEDRSADVVRLLRDEGALRAVHPSLGAPDRVIDAVGRLPDIAPSHRDAVLFCLLLSGARPEDVDAAIARLALTGRQATAVRDTVGLREEKALATPALRPSEAVRLLSRCAVPAIEAFALVAGDERARARTRQYLASWRSVRPRLNGRDLETLGVPHGPRVGEALEALRAARLDGDITTRDEEVALLRTRGFVEAALVESRRG